jgi:dihydroflavonol-4-reductase
MEMRLFVTGATGFIGGHLVRQLSESDHSLRCLVRETSDVGGLEEIGAELVTGDLTDRRAIVNGMTGCDAAVHLASCFEFWVPDRRVYRQANVIGQQNVMEGAIESDLAKVVSVSTVAVYGSADWPVSEASEPGTRRFGEYAQTKHEGEVLAWDLHRQRGLPLVTVYPGAVVGPNDPKAVGRYLETLISGRMPAQVLPHVPFPWVHVRDVCNGIQRALEQDGTVGERYLLVSENLTFGEVNQIISDLTGVRLPRFSLPGWLTMLGAYPLTWLANLTGRPPWLDMSVDQIALMRHGMEVDGSKATRELGVEYTPIRVALEEAVRSLRAPDGRAGAP